jgi:hypothetical protein
VLHFPARGTFYAAMPARSADGERRIGMLRAGTREFGPLQGEISERWVPNTGDDDADAPDGRIELVTSFVGDFRDDVTASTLTESSL